jgi:HTH-type transcriptional regulator/antitoxin HigA
MTATRELKELSKAWAKPAVRELLSPIRTEKQYAAVERLVESLLVLVGEREKHPLASLLDLLSLHMETYESEHYSIAGASGREVLRFLMEQHGLKQIDLVADFGGQGNVSAVLGGKRELNVRQIQALARRFKVSPAVFFGADAG